VIIGYASGSNTHEADFQVVIDPLREVLSKYKNVELHILGYLPFDIEIFPLDLHSRIKLLKIVDHNLLLEEINRWDINIAPLEVNDFTDGKSELKFVHASLVNVPTIASPTKSFVACIVDAKTGYLAGSPSDWIRVLEMLILSESLRSEIGTAAGHFVNENYNLEVLTSRIAAMYRELGLL
jgi:glycosyltransferase involved in cell wall biosynthesis